MLPTTSFRLKPEKNFLDKPAPPGYIAGVGRGATGFITRPDLGPDTEEAVHVPIKGIDIVGQYSKQQQQQIGAKRLLEADAKTTEDLWLQKHAALNIKIQKKFDVDDVKPEVEEEEEVEEEGILGKGNWDREDEEADAIYSTIEKTLSSRKLKKNDTRDDTREDLSVFANLKHDLEKVTAAEWEALPEAEDFTKKRLNKRGKKENKRERYTPLPDSLLLPRSMEAIEEEKEDKIKDTPEIDFAKISEARERVIGGRLDQIHQGIELKPVDRDQYLQELQTVEELGELARARRLFRNLVSSNPDNPEGWLAYAHLEMKAGNTKKARLILQQATTTIPDSESLWYELAMIDPSSLRKALKSCPGSEKLCILALKRERIASEQIKIIKKTLEVNRNCPILWKLLCSLVDEPTQLKYLSMAIEYCPNNVDLWIHYAKLMPKDQSSLIWENSRQHCIDEDSQVRLWIEQAKFEESLGSNPINVIETAVCKAPVKNWLSLAFACEGEDKLQTAFAIIDQLENLDASHLDAQYPKSSLYILLEKIIPHDSHNPQLWAKATTLNPGLLETAIRECPFHVSFWLQLVNLYPENKQEILEKSLITCPNNIELVCILGEFYEIMDWTKADQLYSKYPESEECWIRRCKLYMLHRNTFLTEALERFPENEVLWSLYCQLDPTCLEKAIRTCPKSSSLWISYALHQSTPARIRSIFEQARRILSTSVDIWIASLDFEHSQSTAYNHLLTRAPDCGRVWKWIIDHSPRSLRKSKAIQAYNKHPQDSYILESIATILEEEGRHDLAMTYRSQIKK